MTDTPNNKEREAELREQLFAGKTLKENLQDIVAKNNTGYSYSELVDDEIEQIDRTVNLLAHLIQYDRRQFAERVLAQLHDHENTNVPSENLNAQEDGEVMGHNNAMDIARAAIASQLSGGEEQS